MENPSQNKKASSNLSTDESRDFFDQKIADQKASDNVIDLAPLLNNLAKSKGEEYSSYVGKLVNGFTQAVSQSSETKSSNHLVIKNFKKILGEIRLDDIAPINYIVGKNGHGKSSLLAALSFLSNDKHSENTKRKMPSIERSLFRNDTRVSLRLDSLNAIATADNDDIEVKGQLSLQVVWLKNEIVSGVQIDPTLNRTPTREEFHHLESSLDLARHPELVARRIFQDPFDNNSSRLAFFEQEREIEISLLSQGVQSLHKMFILIDEAIERRAVDEEQYIVILIEEPENNLHPGLQKEIPKILHHYIAEYNDDGPRRLFFFLSTHSPFIISAAAKLDYHKVFMLDEGYLLDNQGNKVEQNNGYDGQECAFIVGQMLGSDVTDLGYPENYCILEEYSLQVILDDCKKKGILKNIQFVSASGANRQISLEATIQELSNLNTLIKCNPYYLDKYLMIIDNMQTSGFSRKELDKIEKIRERLSFRFIEFEESSLENYYKDFDELIYVNTIKSIAEAAGQQLKEGIAKSAGAAQIAQKINSKEDFSRLFRGELDLLLSV